MKKIISNLSIIVANTTFLVFKENNEIYKIKLLAIDNLIINTLNFLCKKIWTRRDLNPGPSASEADILPLDYGPYQIYKIYS